MIYVLEGIDGSGKTTLAERLGAALGAPVFPDEGRHGFAGEFVTPRDWLVRSMQFDLDVACFSQFADLVLDRWLMSSRVYGRRRDAVLDEVRTRAIYRRAEAVVFLLCLAPEVAVTRLQARDGAARYSATALDLIALELEREARIAVASGVWVVRVDAGLPPDDLLSEVVDILLRGPRGGA